MGSMRPWLSVVASALFAVSGCTRHPRVVHRPVRAPKARLPVRRRPQRVLPKMVDLVHFDLAHFGSGTQVYGISGDRESRGLRRSRSVTGLVRVQPKNLQWGDGFGTRTDPREAFIKGSLMYRLDGDRSDPEGKCSVFSHADGAIYVSGRGTGLIEALPSDLATATLQVPGKALERVGPGEVSGVPVTFYRFDARVPWVTRDPHLITYKRTPNHELVGTVPAKTTPVRIAGVVALDARNLPLQTDGDLTPPPRPTGGAPVTPPDIHFWFASHHLGGHDGPVEFKLPDTCANQSQLVSDMALVPVPDGAKGPPPYGRGSQPHYMVAMSRSEIRAYYMKALSQHGWHIESADDAGIDAHRSALHLHVQVAPGPGGKLVIELFGRE